MSSGPPWTAAELEEVVGTVAGDDTVLVVVDELVGGGTMAERLRDVAGIAATHKIALNGKDEDEHV